LARFELEPGDVHARSVDVGEVDEVVLIFFTQVFFFLFDELLVVLLVLFLFAVRLGLVAKTGTLIRLRKLVLLTTLVFIICASST